MLTTLISVLPHNKILEIRPLESLRQEITSQLNRSDKKGKIPSGLPIYSRGPKAMGSVTTPTAREGD